MTSGLILGVITGLTYGLLAVGIVLIFKANRFINLAHAQLGTLSALLLARFVLNNGWSWWIAFPVVVAVGAATALVIERFIIRPMLRKKRHTVSLLLVTVGVAQLLLALTYVKSLTPNQTAVNLRGYPVPFDTHVNLGAFVLRGEHVLILILVPLVVAGLAAFLRFTVWGKAIRAAASNHDAARLCGIPVSRVSAVAWGIAGGLSAITAVLQAPSQGTFDAAALGPALLLRTLGAAAFGGFTSIPLALVGGLVIAMGEHLTLGIKHQTGPAELVVLLTVIGILFVRGRAITASAYDAGVAPEEAGPVRVPAAAAGRAFTRWSPRTLTGLLVFGAVLVPVMPFFDSNSHRFQLVITLVMAIAGVALTMLLGWAGQISLGHYALLGLGAYLMAKLQAHGLSLPMILFFAGAAGALTMVIIGLPALRLQGLTLALTTLGFAVVAPIWLFQQPWLGARGQTAVYIDPPGFAHLVTFGSQLSVYYATLGFLALTVVVALRIRRGLPGRLILAVRDNETALATYGFVPATVKLMILAVSGAIVAMAGVLWACSWRTVSIDLVRPESSLILLAIPVIGGLGSIPGAVAAACLVYLPAFFISPHLQGLFGSFGHQVGFQLALAGLGLIVFPLSYPAGLAGVGRDVWQKVLDRVARSAVRGDEGPRDDRPLVVTDIVKQFGGLDVLRGVSIDVSPGEIVGLIGPNGAGKTTLMNIISGNLDADGGEVAVFGRPVTDLAPELRAHFGLGRVYQEAKLFPGLTVRETLQVALARTQRVGVLSVVVGAPWARHLERRSQDQADAIIERLGLTAWADSLTADLSTGTRRVCELGAQLAAAPRVLLLDEPTAGVAQREAESFGPLLRRIRDELDCSILIIEHDMPLLMGVCDRVYAMDTGQVIACGTPDEMRNHPDVIASYLGTTEVAIARSGRR
ncbi:MAG: ATP-binding cassette domain-containing protein [Actinobacteria bacterium]|nr:ATP-binding cassette domain-containing protein [Actinomycetota bacterium]